MLLYQSGKAWEMNENHYDNKILWYDSVNKPNHLEHTLQTYTKNINGLFTLNSA